MEQSLSSRKFTREELSTAVQDYFARNPEMYQQLLSTGKQELNDRSKDNPIGKLLTDIRSRSMQREEGNVDSLSRLNNSLGSHERDDETGVDFTQIKSADPDGTGVKFLNDDALQLILKTLPRQIQEQVKAKVDKNGLLKKGALDKIKSTDGNFLDLKAAVNTNGTIEVITASEPGDGTRSFYYKSSEKAKAEIIENMVKNGSTRQEALDWLAEHPNSRKPIGTWGRTMTADQSPSGNIRAAIADGKGASADMPEIDRVVTAAHELYGHALPMIQGRPAKHEDPGVPGPINTHHRRIEERTQRTYEQNQRLPTQVKPRQ